MARASAVSSTPSSCWPDAATRATCATRLCMSRKLTPPPCRHERAEKTRDAPFPAGYTFPQDLPGVTTVTPDTPTRRAFLAAAGAAGAAALPDGDAPKAGSGDLKPTGADLGT